MIIELILDALFAVFNILTTPINIPSFPDSATEVIDSAMEYITAGGGILANYVNLTYLFTLFSIILAIDVGVALYHFVMWVIRKIPMANMS